jgi:hypothetical protein
MKKMIVASFLALALTASARQEASAWTKCSFSCGFNISYESTGSCCSWGFSCVPNPPPCGYGYSGGYCPPYPGGFSGYGLPSPMFGYAPAAGPQAVPAVGQQAAPAVNASHTQQAGYYFYGQGSAPSYWYGY